MPMRGSGNKLFDAWRSHGEFGSDFWVGFLGWLGGYLLHSFHPETADVNRCLNCYDFA